MKICSNCAVLASLLFAAATAFANPTVSSPANGATVPSTFNLSANASSCSNAAIAAMGYSLDNSPNTTIVYGSSINASVSAATGTHTLHVKSWGQGGASCVTDVAITVSGVAPAQSVSGEISVGSPSEGATVYSPFTIGASASTCGGHSTAAMGYSFDNSPSTTIVNGNWINTLANAANGAHTLHIKAWGNGGGACDTDIPINVIAPANAAVVPSSAISVANIDNLANWLNSNDSAAQGSSNGSSWLVGSPSRTGSAREFVTNFWNNGNERYYVSFGDDTSSTNFLYDTWVYVQAPSTSLANVEMDMNQTMPNGQTAIFGFQCDGWNSTWDYTKNAGTPQNPQDVWVKTNQYCNPRTWSTNTWHHVQVAYSRDSSGNITYQTVWLDDQPQTINVTVNSAFALGWAPSLLTNFQVDGIGNGQAVVYMDNLTIYRW
ncbi:MAG: hypothetical protein ACLGXA_05695 [Acidobacteriota bacterium]